MAAEYRLTAEVFVIPHESSFLLYAPLKGVVAEVNRATALLLRDLQRGDLREASEAEAEVLAPLIEVGVVNGPPDPRLTVHQEGAFQPLHVTLFVTDACNLRCLYCYANGGDNPKPSLIPAEAARAGIDLVAANALAAGRPLFSVGFHGAGEPTVGWRRYTELVDYAHRRADELGLGVSVTTCTNAVMSADHARWVTKHTHAATVSLDGYAELHDRHRPKVNGSGSFADVARTLRIFDEAGFFYGLRATITEHNVGHMAEMVEYLTDAFNPGDLQFDPLLVSGRCHLTGIRPPDDEGYVREFIRAYETARRRNRMLGFSCLSFTALKSFYCCAVSDGFTVTHDGWVTACFEACGPDRPFGDLFVYGRYDQDRDAFDLDLDKLRRLQGRHVYNLPHCEQCFCKYMCGGDCPMYSLKQGLGLDRGARCALTQAVARHRLATVAREGRPQAVVRRLEEAHA